MGIVIGEISLWPSLRLSHPHSGYRLYCVSHESKPGVGAISRLRSALWARESEDSISRRPTGQSWVSKEGNDLRARIRNWKCDIGREMEKGGGGRGRWVARGPQSTPRILLKVNTGIQLQVSAVSLVVQSVHNRLGEGSN